MRTEMKKLNENTMYSFEGRFVRFGTYQKRTHARGHLGKKITLTSVLLKNVRLENGHAITDHA